MAFFDKKEIVLWLIIFSVSAVDGNSKTTISEPNNDFSSPLNPWWQATLSIDFLVKLHQRTLNPSFAKVFAHSAPRAPKPNIVMVRSLASGGADRSIHCPS